VATVQPVTVPVKVEIEIEDLSESTIRQLTDRVLAEMARRDRRNGSLGR